MTTIQSHVNSLSILERYVKGILMSLPKQLKVVQEYNSTREKIHAVFMYSTVLPEEQLISVGHV